MMVSSWCRRCGELDPDSDNEVEYEEYGGDVVTCGVCGCEFDTAHECSYDPESGEAWCYDYIEESKEQKRKNDERINKLKDLQD